MTFGPIIFSRLTYPGACAGALGHVALFDFAGELETEPFVFEDEIKSNESLSLEALRTLST